MRLNDFRPSLQRFLLALSVSAVAAPVFAAELAMITDLEGSAAARRVDGSVRDLEQGDALYNGETLLCGDDARLTLSRPDGSTLVVGASCQLPMSAPLVAYYQQDALDGGTTFALSATGQGVGSLLEVLHGQGDINAALEATAAGAPRASGAESLVDATPIGTNVAIVTKLEGIAHARTADGGLRELQEGDVLYQGETLVTDAGTTATLELHDGHTIIVRGERSLPMTVTLATYYYEDALSGSTTYASTSGTPSGESKEVGELLKALSGGQDINATLEATAAGRKDRED